MSQVSIFESREFWVGVVMGMSHWDVTEYVTRGEVKEKTGKESQ